MRDHGQDGTCNVRTHTYTHTYTSLETSVYVFLVGGLGRDNLNRGFWGALSNWENCWEREDSAKSSRLGTTTQEELSL